MSKLGGMVAQAIEPILGSISLNIHDLTAGNCQNLDSLSTSLDLEQSSVS
jgi:hypothetical protein